MFTNASFFSDFALSFLVIFLSFLVLWLFSPFHYFYEHFHWGISKLRDGEITRWCEMTLFSEIFKLRDEEIQIAIWENPNCEIEPNLVKVKKSKLRYKNIQIARWNKKLPKLKNPNCEIEWKMMGNIQIVRWNQNWQK